MSQQLIARTIKSTSYVETMKFLFQNSSSRRHYLKFND